MFKLRTLGLVLALLVFANSAVSAPMKLLITVDCDSDAAEVLDLAQGKQFQEQPIAQGRGAVALRSVGNQMVAVDTLITANTLTGTYTVIALFENGYACMLLPGGELQLLDQDK